MDQEESGVRLLSCRTRLMVGIWVAVWYHELSFGNMILNV